ncbi:hypothetical protein UU7_08513 [Rhodanobacter spathiphylli B39]|uniref:Uncharacterized protein n=1 Tax=Rhodanobacter spathiphylli B39 TaxID=1163407 RepID=I4W1X7_9GAMM|nr:hypothetical protein UU7_08513 [Rhodanobacter spathiphylli B39]
MFAWGVLVFLALPVRRYDWMQQMDPSVTAPPDAGSDNGAMFALLLLAAIVISQAALIATAKSRRERILGIVVVVVAIALWASRHWR